MTLTVASQRRPLRRSVLATVLAVAGCRFCYQSVGFASAPVLERPARSTEGGTAVEERPKRKTEEEEFKDRLKAMNLTLESETGEPDDIVPGVTHGTPYVTCFVEYEDRSHRDDEGTVKAAEVIEEWVMRGDDSTVNSFTSWRQRGVDVSSLRCIQTASQQALEETVCMECISPSPSHAASNVPGAIVGTVHPSSVMTFSGLRHCLSTTGGRPGFCKSGKVSVPM
mmetsp:Transcript_95413/g.169388  ORF Transcript_95413/g.169388 Transcript_95413/m.169388 type:complete len:225 (+) Transcript_95413:155-829(+)|eukprot:CAMPEP_0197660066 /NCGR_PEP_ID=MMETSP1338-20131121/50289_1 /TAXON_ID=43686 ORGANISM="Pelagodinium beii, Strain RCC1491" /NCGR_SAMPLE_ID=MMETSP1338 /ASSEMBLY_ACC=CAM_ASM_000754 /LENGTH=224 /DNA_ID=CAMNT_0043237311 /DNA_START=138 /DNA_END=812 /DNA_ORIENTATION=-